MKAKISSIAALLLLPALASGRQAPPGVSNYTRLDATVACAGDTSTESFPELKRQGFAAIINLRQSSEPGVDIERSTRAAETVGLRYIHIPMSSSEPEPAAVDAFLTAVRDPANSPVFIHCATANRVGAVWLVKRMLVDGWDEQRAVREAETIGLRRPNLREFALEYVRQHQAR